MVATPSLQISLSSAEARDYLVEAGSLVLVVEGCVEMIDSPQWIADHYVALKRSLQPEIPFRIEVGGWIQLRAQGPSEIVLIAPQGLALWARIGDCLRRWLGTGQSLGGPIG